jgi:hypothetical protein
MCTLTFAINVLQGVHGSGRPAERGGVPRDPGRAGPGQQDGAQGHDAAGHRVHAQHRGRHRQVRDVVLLHPRLGFQAGAVYFMLVQAGPSAMLAMLSATLLAGQRIVIHC